MRGDGVNTISTMSRVHALKTDICTSLGIDMGERSESQIQARSEPELHLVPHARSIALLLAIVGAAIIMFSWAESYPLYLQSGNSEIFFSIPSGYWFGFLLALPSLLALSYTAKRAQAAVASVSMFLLLFSLNFFYYTPYGNDQFFQNLTLYYFGSQGGHISSVFQQEYRWPGLFLVAEQLHLVAALPLRCYVYLLFLLFGVLIATGVFLIVERRSLRPGAAMLGFALLSFNFLNYQFAAQTLALVLVLLFVATDLRLGVSQGRSVVQVILFTAACFTHLFFPVFLVIYRCLLMIRGRPPYERRGVVALFLLIYVTVLGYYTVFLGNVVLTLRNSFVEAFAIESYTHTFTVSAITMADAAVQLFSRATILATAAIAGLMLLWMLRKKELKREDIAFGAAGMFYLLAGSIFLILGQRAFQIIAVPGGLGVGRFGAIRHNLSPVVLVVLALTAVSLPLHLSFNASAIQDPITAEQVSFMASHFGTKPATVLMESQTAPLLTHSAMLQGTDLYVDGELMSAKSYLHSYDHYMISTVLLHNMRVGLVETPIAQLILGSDVSASGYNRVIDNSRDRWLVSVTY